MDVEKAGLALGSGDLEGFMAFCDESERIDAIIGNGVMILGRMGVLTIEYQSAQGRNDLQAHQHSDESEAGACYANMVMQTREAAAQVNALANMLMGRSVVTANTDVPDYIPGDWKTV